MRPQFRSATALAALVVSVLILSGCNSAEDWSEPHTRPTAVGSLGPGFTDPAAPPSPEATVTPEAGSWNGVAPPEGYRVVLLTAGGDDATATVASAVTAWAHEARASLKTVTAGSAADYLPSIDRAIALNPDLIITAGNDLVDALTAATPHHLDRQFLVIGAELAEPTGNVTAADWVGASFRGEGLGMSSTYDPSTFTPERAGRAVRAGVAAVLHNVTGIVILLD
ncbi:MAG: hypothetical protein JWN20_693 [Jatrophihabitantaceae bacterium]|nr:hypothetical protein [Jatrophihabitantaceae bacterium]